MKKPRKPVEPCLPHKYERQVPSRFITTSSTIFSIQGLLSWDEFKKKIDALYARVKELDEDAKFVKGSLEVDICESYYDNNSLEVMGRFETDRPDSDYDRIMKIWISQTKADDQRYKRQLSNFNKSKKLYEEKLLKYKEEIKLYEVYLEEVNKKAEEREREAEIALLKKLKKKYKDEI